MKALILNSGLGSRMGVFTSEHPKCMTEISFGETILSRQLKLLADAGVKEVVMTTGLFDEVLVEYCKSLELPLKFTFVKNPKFRETNYIYSIYCAREYLDDSIILMHGDLVFEAEVLDKVVASASSCMTVSSTSFALWLRRMSSGKTYEKHKEIITSNLAEQTSYHDICSFFQSKYVVVFGGFYLSFKPCANHKYNRTVDS